MANKIANRKAICDTLLEAAATDKDIVVLCSDSRGSASLTPFFDQYPQQSVEVGIAEQDLVSIAAGMASCGKKAWAASPASFVTTRSYEQCKVDVSYSNTNVKLIGISGGVSYGALGMSHHSAQDIAAMSGGNYQLDNLCALVDRNRLQISGSTEDVMKQDSQEERWAAFGWNVLSIPGNDVQAIDAALTLAAETKGKPTVIILNTVKGYGSPVMEDKASWHHHLPNDEEYAQIIADFAAHKEAING